MPAQNAFLLTCARSDNRDANCLCRDECRRQCIERMVAVRSDDALYEEYRSIVDFQEEHLNDMWDLTVQHIITGFSLYRKCTLVTGLQSFGPAMNNLPAFRHMQPRERRRLCRKISLIKGVYENWRNIVANVTHQSMIHVDVRKFSINQLSQCVNFQWVKNYNDAHAPTEERRPKPQPEYPRDLIVSILTNINDTGILDMVNYDPDQVRLIGKDLLSGMLGMPNN
jgi:hypothetical protein